MVLDYITYYIKTLLRLKQYATKLYQKRLAECIKTRYPRIVRYKVHTLIIKKMIDLFYRHINNSWNVKNSLRSSWMIYYGLFDKRFTPKNWISCVPNRLFMVKFYIYTTNKVIFFMESFVQWPSSIFQGLWSWFKVIVLVMVVMLDILVVMVVIDFVFI